MRPDEIRLLLDQRPFRPFRLHLSSGDVIRVTHPEMAALGPGIIRVALWSDVQGEWEAVLGLLHVTWIERLASSSDNSGESGDGTPAPAGA